MAQFLRSCIVPVVNPNIIPSTSLEGSQLTLTPVSGHLAHLLPSAGTCIHSSLSVSLFLSHTNIHTDREINRYMIEIDR